MTQQKTILACLFGGRAAEHDVSIITGLQAMDNADASKYEIQPIYIARDGKWYTGAALRNIDSYRPFKPDAADVYPCTLSPVPGEGLRIVTGKTLLGAPKAQVIQIGVALIAMHGMGGEDGALQGLFELADIPYTSAGLSGSAVGMDKIVMKAAFRGNDIPVVEGVFFDRDEFAAGREAVVARIEAALPYPIFVKPSNLGSSIGISKAKDREGLIQAIEVASHYDRRILAERGVNSPMEINCSVVGFGDDVRASLCEQPLAWQEFLTFEDKYLQGGKSAKTPGSKGMASQGRKIPAPISEEMTQRIQSLAEKAFRALDCKGVVRVDFLIDTQTQDVYVCEINTIPGSLAFYLWEPLGLSYPRLIDELVRHAMAAHAQKQRSGFAYDSGLLQQYGKRLHGAKGGKR